MSVYRNDVDALAARRAALAGEVEAKKKELDDATRLLAEAKARARLPVLDNIRVASPCTAEWSKMTGDERVRHCAACDKDVFNLSAMTRDEAQALIAERAGNLCARYYQRKDGTILLADCTIGVRQRRRRRWVAAGAAALLVGGAGAASAFTLVRDGDARSTHEARYGEPLMGAVAVDPVTDRVELERAAVERAAREVEAGHAIMGGLAPDPASLPTTPPKLHLRPRR